MDRWRIWRGDGIMSEIANMEDAMADATLCRDPALHEMHYCKLKKKGLTAELAARTTAPAFVCHNCGARTDRASDVCNPSPLPK